MNDPAHLGVASGSVAYPPGTLLGDRFRVKDHLQSLPGVAVYRASDAQSGDEVSLFAFTLSGPERAVLERELAKAQRVGQHKNIGPVVGVASTGDQVFVAYAWQEGHSLREILGAQRAKGGAVPIAQAYTLFGHVVAALEAASSYLFHGSLSLDNIWVSGNGRVRLTQFGLCTAVVALTRKGHPYPGAPYLAPELAIGVVPSLAADVYSLGAILYELISGFSPVPPLEPPSRRVPGIPTAVDAVVGRALLPNAPGRQISPRAFLEAFGQAAGLAPGPSVTPAPVAVSAPPAAESAGSPVPPAAEGTEGATGDKAEGRKTGKAFDVAAAARLSQGAARWLVQRDRLDYGPFSLEQVKAQIAEGQFRGDNLIVDMDSGARQKIVDHPQLGEFARSTARQLEHARRLKADQAHEHVERKRSRMSLMIIGGAVLLVVVVLGAFLLNREAADEGELASRVGEGDIDEFLKGVKVDFPSTRRPTARRAGRAASGAGAKDDPFSAALNLGDVTQGGENEILSDRQIQAVMMSNYRKLVPCIMNERRRSPGVDTMDLEFVVTGGGKVTAVKVNGQQNGPFAGCVLSRMKTFNFPSYKGSRTIASWSMAVR